MARRWAALAVAGVLVLAGLTGCRSEPGSAAFVAGTRITTAQVDDIVSGLKADGTDIPADQEGPLKSRLASLMVFQTVAQKYAESKGYPAPTPDYTTVAQANQLSVNDPFVQLLAQSQAYLVLLESQIPAATLTEADFTEAAKVAGAGGAQGSNEQLASAIKLQYAKQVATAVAVRNELAAAVKQYNVSVNPLFSPAVVALASTSSGIPLVVLPLANGSTQPRSVGDIVAVD